MAFIKRLRKNIEDEDELRSKAVKGVLEQTLQGKLRKPNCCEPEPQAAIKGMNSMPEQGVCSAPSYIWPRRRCGKGRVTQPQWCRPSAAGP